MSDVYISAILFYMRNLIFITAGVLLWLSLFRPVSSSQLFDLGEWYFESFEELEDLAVDVLTTIIQDKHGFIWMGSQNGLLRYDGYTFKQFLPELDNPNSIGGRYIQSIEEVGDTLWIGTYSDGISIYNPNTQHFTHHQHDPQDPLSLADNDVRDLVLVNDHLFVGTKNGINLFTTDGRSLGIIQILGCKEVMSQGRVNALLYDAGLLWIGTVNGLCRLSLPAKFDAGQTWQGTEVIEFREQRIFHLAVDNLKQIWVGTTSNGAAVIQPGSLTITKIGHDENDPNKLDAAWIDEFVLVDDQMWLATAGAGVAIIDTRTLDIVRHIKRQEGVPNTLSLDDISAFLKDRSGLIWIGTWGGGLNRFNPANKAFRTLRTNHLKTNTLSHPDIRAIKEMENGDIWFGSFVNGIDVLSPKHGVIRGFRPDPGDPLALQGGYVFSIEQMPGGDIWVSTLDHGIFKYLPEKDGFRQFVDDPGLSDNTIRTLKSDGERWLWVGTDDGLSLMDTETETLTLVHYFGSRKRPFDKVVESIAVYGGYAWVATNQGLFLADKETATAVPVVSPEDKALADNFITDIHITPGGDVYFANSLGFEKLSRWDASGMLRGEVMAEFESISAKVGKRGASIGSTILEDEQGRLWVQNSVVDTENWSLTSINKSSGWDIGNLWIGSNEKLRDGTLLFGGTRGVLVIRPELYEKWTFEPDILTTLITKDSLPIAPADASPLVIEPTVESFFVEFTALDFSEPDKIQYQYKMEGYDSNWIQTDAKNRRASYTRLQPGNYTLRIKATNREGIWSDKELTLNVVQLPAWYQTWWVRLMMFIAFSLMLIGFYKFRVASLNQQKRTLDGIVAARTADLELLGQIGKDITSSLEIEEVMNAVYHHVAQLIEADVFLMGSLDLENDSIKVLFLKEKNDRCDNVEYELSDANRPAVWCVQQQKPLITQNRLELLEYVGEIQMPKFGNAMESIIYLPLEINDKVVGCLSVQSNEQNAYSQNDIDMLQKVVAYAAIALTNAESHNKLESAHNEIERISLTDQLTGARNRRFLENIMPVEMARIKRARSDNSPVELGFVLMDIDHFKVVNDTWGHDAGDQLLVQFVELLFRICRESDWVVRLGGEEFVVVAQIENEQQLMALAERIRKAVQEMSFKIAPDLVLNKTCSIGLVTVPFVSGDFKKISWQKCLNIADHAMYAAKKNGRNAWIAILAQQSEIDSNLYQRLMNEPDQLLKEEKIKCPSSFPDDKQWQFD